MPTQKDINKNKEKYLEIAKENYFLKKIKDKEGLDINTYAAATSLQSCPTLCDPIDGSPPGSSVHGIFQARVLECGAIAYTNKT